MVVEYIRYKVPSADQAAFKLGLAHVLKQLDNWGSCLGYELTEAKDEPGVLVLRIEWVKGSVPAHLRPSPFIEGVVVNGRPFPQWITERQEYRPTGISKHKP